MKSAKCRDCSESRNGFVRVFKFEEKRTDVNMAVAVVRDAAMNRADSFVLVTGDSDQVETVRAVRKDFEKQVLVFDPHDTICDDLKKAATFYKPVPRDLPARCQLPDAIPVGTHGNVIRRPTLWR